MMSGISSQVHKGKPIVMNQPLKVLITPSHRFTSCNQLVDKTVLLQHRALGHWLLRRPSHFAPPEVQVDQYQLVSIGIDWAQRRWESTFNGNAPLTWLSGRRRTSPPPVGPGRRVQASLWRGSPRFSSNTSSSNVAGPCRSWWNRHGGCPTGMSRSPMSVGSADGRTRDSMHGTACLQSTWLRCRRSMRCVQNRVLFQGF